MKSAIKPNALPQEPTIFGSDISGDMVTMTRHNLKIAGIMFDVPLKQIEAQEVRPPTEQPGILLTNPPYGERIGVRGDSTMPADDMAVGFYSAFCAPRSSSASPAGPCSCSRPTCPCRSCCA